MKPSESRDLSLASSLLETAGGLHVYLCTCLCVYNFACVILCGCMCVLVHVCMHLCVHTCAVYTCLCVCACVCMHVWRGQCYAQGTFPGSRPVIAGVCVAPRTGVEMTSAFAS